jgi:hypothetical protein
VGRLLWQKSFVEDDLEEDPDAAGAEAVDAGPHESLLQKALLVGAAYLRKEQKKVWKQGDKIRRLFMYF